MAASIATYLMTYMFSTTSILVAWMATTFLVRVVGGYLVSKMEEIKGLSDQGWDMLNDFKNQLLSVMYGKPLGETPLPQAKELDPLGAQQKPLKKEE